MNKIILFLICIAILTSPVIATDYTATVRLDTITVSNGNNTWTTSPDLRLNITDTKTLMGVTIYYYDISTDGTTIYLKTITDRTNDFPIKKLDTICVKGTCKTDPTQAAIGDIRLTLMDLVAINTPATSSTVNGTSDNPIYAYLYTDREWALVKDGTVNFDAKAQKTSSDSGVTYSTTNSLKEVYVYFKRLQTVPVSISVTSKVKEPKSLWDNEKIKFTVDESDTYVFTVKYSKTNPWGAAADTTNTYTLVVTGLESATAQPVVYATAPYDVFSGDTKTITMTEPGKFSTVSGIAVTQQSNTTFSFAFSTPGTYNVGYTTDKGTQTNIIFNVATKSIATLQNQETSTNEPEPTATVIGANQVQGGSVLGIDNWYLGGALIFLVLGIIYMKKNKGRSGGTSHYEPKARVG